MKMVLKKMKVGKLFEAEVLAGWEGISTPSSTSIFSKGSTLVSVSTLYFDT